MSRGAGNGDTIMGEQSELGPWAKQVAERYLGECRDLKTDQIVAGLERAAYKLARDGKSKRAAKLFIAVADITKSSGDNLK